MYTLYFYKNCFKNSLKSFVQIHKILIFFLPFKTSFKKKINLKSVKLTFQLEKLSDLF